jgi:[glutamine synthetase] adenylyltransferase / [glutamine synthetase]-adenylyl-L-tyrosine phosphorylase
VKRSAVRSLTLLPLPDTVKRGRSAAGDTGQSSDEHGMSADLELLLSDHQTDRRQATQRLQQIGFADLQTARGRFASLCSSAAERRELVGCLPALLYALETSASPDGSLLNFERFIQSVPDRLTLFDFLGRHPRAVEILLRLFVGSQFLSEILIRQPRYLERLTRHQQLAAVKHRAALADEARHAARQGTSLAQRLDEVRRVQKWELLRLGACDQFGLMDLKTVTLQLSLLADAVTQVCLELLAAEGGIEVGDFAVLAMGKLGGEELNYSSDIDLVFIAGDEAERYWPLGQRLIRALTESTRQGFLYRVDMRLRPWGRSGPLVCTADSYLDYLQRHGQLWEKQALLKARCIAGNAPLAEQLLDRMVPILFDVTEEEVRQNVLEMKHAIEAKLTAAGREWGQVKTGQGGIRDVEFLVQGLQLIHGRALPAVRSINTLDSLVRLADHGILQAEEYRCLRTGYAFLRMIEHALQLMHNEQMHALPRNPRELAYLARRLDFEHVDEFVRHYDQHCREIRRIFDRHFCGSSGTGQEVPPAAADVADSRSRSHFGTAADTYEQVFDDPQRQQHLRLLERLSDDTPACVEAQPLDADRCELTVVGFDQIGDLSAICGLLLVFGYNIESGVVFTGTAALLEGPPRRPQETRRRKFVDVFTIRPVAREVTPAAWKRYESDLVELLRKLAEGRPAQVHGELAKRVASALRSSATREPSLLPVEIAIDNATSSEHTILDITATDSVGFLYELANALNLSGVSVVRMQIRSIGDRVVDTLHVTDRAGNKLVDEQKLLELRAAIVLIKHFTHLLPSSPNPESALLHFRELLQQLFSTPNWLSELAVLQDSHVLSTLSRLLGVSDFLWHDYLKLQHANLFPVIADQQALQMPRSKRSLEQELRSELAGCGDRRQRRKSLNDFKDRQMLRVDVRHILGLQRAFGLFARELTDVSEVIVEAARTICFDELTDRYGVPLSTDGVPSRLAVCALGKCGGRELGFASDIELMFVYDADGQTDGDEVVSCLEFYTALVECFRKSIDARRKGIFEVDLRLRPYGQAGPLAVSLQAFEKYFGPDGAAWPYERQALVKLRPIAGDLSFGEEVVAVRDCLLYTGKPFEVTAIRAMREKQLHQLVTAGTFNAKLSPGALVDCEYLVQALQITHGADHPAVRVPNTRDALKALESAGVLSRNDRITLRDAYRFFRRVIDALRMVRGDARDLTVPPTESEEFQFLARRLGYENGIRQLQQDLETHTARVRELSSRLIETGV